MRIFQAKKNILLLFFWLSSFSHCALAQNFYEELTIPESYPKDYILGQISSNLPTGNGKKELLAHLNSPGFVYHHRLAHPWMVSVGYRPQSFIKQGDHQPISLMTLSNTTQRIFRLYHPFYFLAGTEILYLIPVLKINPPMVKDPDFATEIGVGARVSLWYLLSQKSILVLDVERWRGTKTDRLHGISVSFGLGLGF
ncbi:MAG: hypothetical protein NTX25_17695 [Proteobacteria bacterium]|nr:hypothetical protein [Pseudomonadota bacterium]